MGRKIVGVTVGTPINPNKFKDNTAEAKVSEHDKSTTAHSDIRTKIEDVQAEIDALKENGIPGGSGGGDTEYLKTITIALNETAPAETVSSICDFTVTPTTMQAAYCMYNQKFVYGDSVFRGREVPLLTTKGDLIVKDADGAVKYSKRIDNLINYRGVSDLLTHKGVHKTWSGKFYLNTLPVTTVLADDYSSTKNVTWTWEFSEKDFANTGLPAKLSDIPMATPCFYNASNSQSAINSRVYFSQPYPAKFTYNAETEKYTLVARGVYDSIANQLSVYSKVYFYYQLEEPYDVDESFAMGISAGDSVSFVEDYKDSQEFIDAGVYTAGWYGTAISEYSIVPSSNVIVPRNTKDALNGMENAARMLNADDSAGGDATVQGYSWIGEGDGVTDYTARLQSKLDEIHTVTNGGTVYLGPGTYPIGGSLIIYSNTRIIGYGVDTVVQQSADNTHAIVISGSDVTLKDFNIRLAGACTKTTACVYVNSDNQAGENGYPSNFYVSNLTMDNIFMSGNYKFEHVDGKPILGDVYHNYKGVGIFCEGLYFNYAHIDNVHGKYLMAVVRYGGGGNYFNITSEFCKYAVYDGGVNNVYFINGHSYYEGNDTDGYVSMSDEVVHDEYSHFNQYTLSLYDCQHFKHYIYFGGGAQTNSFTLNTNFGASVMTNADGMSNPKYALSQQVIDLGRGNIQIAKWQDNAYTIGNKTLQISGQTTMIKCDPVISNVLSGAGVWGNITSNITWRNGGIDLYEICRYKADRIGSNTYLYLPSVISEASPSEDAPIEIEIDVHNRPIYGQLGHFIQFDHRYVASEYIVYYDTQNNGEYDISYTIKDNVDVTCWMLQHQSKPYNIYRIKFVFTKALQIPEFTYQDSSFQSFTIDYNPDGLIGICNIGMTVNDYTGRSFLGECGGSLYGNVDMHQNTLRNLAAPTEDGDAVSKVYLEQRLAELEALISGS